MGNLLAEMARYGVKVADIQELIACTDKTVRNKISGTTDFSVHEAIVIRDFFFPGMRIEYLFSDSNSSAQNESA